MDFEVGVSNQGADLFHKEHYPSMKLHRENGNYYVRGFYNQEEENFIANYFNRYGKAICSIQPAALKHLMLEQLNMVKNHLNSIS